MSFVEGTPELSIRHTNLIHYIKNALERTISYLDGLRPFKS